VFVFVVQKMPKPGRGVPKWGRISSVQTIPEFRNTGIGSALMEKVVAWCKAERLEELVVWPSERSVPFYERAGFKGENKIMEADIWPWE
jgi:GNAT superfamily N-acetyltransferase